MTVLLVFPDYADQLALEFSLGMSQSPHAPLGISCLSASLKAQQIDVTCIDLNVFSLDEFMEQVMRPDIRVVGFSAVALSLPRVQELMAICRKKRPELFLILGGQGVPYSHHTKVADLANVMITGDGTSVISDIIRDVLDGKLTAEDFKNFDTCGNKYELDDMPFPDRECVPLSRYNKSPIKRFNVTTSHSCPHQCLFCLSGEKDHVFRLRSIPNVVKELKEIEINYPQIKTIQFVDETLNNNRPRFRALCEEMKKLKFEWFCNLRPDKTLQMEDIIFAHAAGCRLIEFGIESANERVLNDSLKQLSPIHVEALVSTATSLNLPVMGTFILPHLTDTIDTLYETLTFAEHLVDKYLFIPLVFPTVAMPGSRLHQEAKKFGLELSEGFVIEATNELKSGQLQQVLSEFQQLLNQAVMSRGLTILQSGMIDVDTANLGSVLDQFADQELVKQVMDSIFSSSN